MHRRDVSKVLLASAAGSALLARQANAQTCTLPCYPRTGAEIAASVTPTNYEFPPGDVRRYGAKGNGSNNDGPAIQNAIKAAQANATVFLPPNALSQYYKIDAGLTITKPIRLVGSGQLETSGARVPHVRKLCAGLR